MNLAEQLRPQKLNDVLGQAHLLDEGAPLARACVLRKLPSMILWGPPGSGKTTIARLLGQMEGYHFTQSPATSTSLAEFRKIFDQAKKDSEKKTLLFIDEIHRLTRTQQDIFLSVLESETIILIGATTENPSFALSSALLSRAHVFVLERLEEVALNDLITRAEHHYGRPLPLTDSAKRSLCQMADGDGRFLLALTELVFDACDSAAPLSPEALADLVSRRAPIYDSAHEAHYNLISALHKSIRGSDVDAALYWLARMLAGGENVFYILRRLARAASEDVGMADPLALQQVLAAKESYAFLGSPEGELAVAQAVIYLATAPKSNATYRAFSDASAFARDTGSLPPPKNILNAPTRLMKDLGYGKDYIYEHNEGKRFSGQNFFPEGVARPHFYHPAATGFEKEIAKRLIWWHDLRKKKEDG